MAREASLLTGRVAYTLINKEEELINLLANKPEEPEMEGHVAY